MALFFERVREQMSKNEIMHFPEPGIDFLSKSPDENSSNYKLHNKIVENIKKIIPNDDDIYIRKYIIKTICKNIENNLKEEKGKFFILPYGSCMNGTSLPVSDIDIALFTYPAPSRPGAIMQKLEAKLRNICSDFVPLPSAAIPVMKFKIRPGVSVDLSIDELHGVLTVPFVKKVFSKFPCLLPAQLFFKALLHSRGLNSPYTGGISSYHLHLMLLAYLQYSGEPTNITDFIVGVLDFYGNKFNYILTGIDVRGTGRLFSRYPDHLCLDNPTMYIIDPMNEKNIIGRNSFRIFSIKEFFSDLHKSLVEDTDNGIRSAFFDFDSSVHFYRESLNEFVLSNREEIDRVLASC